MYLSGGVIKLDGSIELISDNKNYNSEIIQKSELNTIKILGKVVGKVGLVWRVKILKNLVWLLYIDP